MTNLAPLHLKNIRVAFHGGVVLRELCLKVPGGAALVVVGANGAGKTTLFNVISGIVVPSAGSVALGSVVLSNMSTAARARRYIARSFQVPKLSPKLSSVEHVRLAMGRSVWFGRSPPNEATTGAASDCANGVLEELGLSKLTHAAVGELTHTNRKMVEIATALASRMPLLLLDEPTSGVGESEKKLLLQALRRRVSTSTMLIIEHDATFVRELSWKAIMIKDGACTGIVDGIPE